jgi:hypothetical protein
MILAQVRDEMGCPPDLQIRVIRIGDRWDAFVEIIDRDDYPDYLVVDDFGGSGRVYREADVEEIDLETAILDLLQTQYRTRSRSSPSTAEKGSQDVRADVRLGVPRGEPGR